MTPLPTTHTQMELPLVNLGAFNQANMMGYGCENFRLEMHIGLPVPSAVPGIAPTVRTIAFRLYDLHQTTPILLVENYFDLVLGMNTNAHACFGSLLAEIIECDNPGNVWHVHKDCWLAGARGVTLRNLLDSYYVNHTLRHTDAVTFFGGVISLYPLAN